MIKMVDINLLKMAEYNPRKELDGKTFEKLKKSFQEFGQAQPIIINSDYTVIAGHQRLKVMKSLKYTEAECKVLNLTKEKEKALNLALNKIQGEWDLDKLSVVIGELFDEDLTEFTGFDEKEIFDLIKETENLHSTDIIDEIIESEKNIISAVEAPQEEREQVKSVPLDSLKSSTETEEETNIERPNISEKLKSFMQNKSEIKIDLSFSVNGKQNQIIVSALEKVKQRDNIIYGAEALAKICEEWLADE